MQCEQCQSIKELYKQQDNTFICVYCLKEEFHDHIGSDPDFNYTETEFAEWIADMSLKAQFKESEV